MNALNEAYAAAGIAWRELAESDASVLYVGAATCGRAAGATAVLERLRAEIAERRLTTRIVEVGCLGPCSLEPMIVVQKPGAPQVCYGEVDAERAVAILERFVLGDDPCTEWALGLMTDGKLDGCEPFQEHPIMRHQVRNVMANCGVIDPEDLQHYLAHDGYRGFLRALEVGPEATVDEVDQARLRGRGGAAFPAARKWKFCRATPSEQKYLICNADEGNPGAFMNRSLLEGDPHAVLEGMLIAAYALGASRGYIYARMEYPLAIHRLELAMGQMREQGLLGADILGSGFDFEITIMRGAGAFVCGEETSLIASIEGHRGMPKPRPPFPAVSGLWGKPTIIQNVESLGNLPLILRRGHAWYTQFGTETSTGTKTFSLAGKVKYSGLIEVPMGLVLRDIVYDIGGGTLGDTELKAVQMGGPSGTCIPADMLHLPVDYDSLAAAGSLLGAGGMIVLDEESCMVDISRHFLTFTQEESCGKCPPCRIGTRAMIIILDRIATGQGSMRDLERLEDLAHTVQNGSLCGLGQAAPNPVLSALKYFREEFEAHIRQPGCPLGVCHVPEFAPRATACQVS